MFIIVLVSAVAVLFRGYSFNTMSQRIGRDIRLRVFKSIVNKDIGFYDENKIGDLVSRIGNDTEVIQDGLSTNISQLIRAIITLVGTIGFLFYVSW